MQRTAKVFRHGGSQAVRLPKEFRFEGVEVFVRRSGDEVILSARPRDWSGFVASDVVASSGFMARWERLS